MSLRLCTFAPELKGCACLGAPAFLQVELVWGWRERLPLALQLLEEATCIRAGSAGLGSGPGPTLAHQACASSGAAQDRAGIAFKRLEELWRVQKAVQEVQSPAKSLGELLRVQAPMGEAGSGAASEAEAEGEALQALQQLLLPQATGGGPPPVVPSADSSSPAGAAVVGASATSSELGGPSPGAAQATAEQQEQQVALLAKLSSLPALATSDLQALLAANAQQQQQGRGQGKGAAGAHCHRIGHAGAARRDGNVADQVRLGRACAVDVQKVQGGHAGVAGRDREVADQMGPDCTLSMSHCCLRS